MPAGEQQYPGATSMPLAELGGPCMGFYSMQTVGESCSAGWGATSLRALSVSTLHGAVPCPRLTAMSPALMAVN